MGLPVAGSAPMSALELLQGSCARTGDLEGLARLCGYPFSVDIGLRLFEQRLVAELAGVSPVASTCPRHHGEASALEGSGTYRRH
jgi:hypothetical protein